MVSVKERIWEELDVLVKQGYELLGELAKDDDKKFKIAYQSWYTRALTVIRQLIPERLEEFTNLYKEQRRKSITVDTYSISDYLQGLAIIGVLESNKTRDAAGMRFFQQYQILESAQTRLDDILTNIYGIVQAEILDNELDAATELLRARHIRSAGTLAGVVLERHLAKVCSSRTLKAGRKKPTLADWNDILKDANVYDIPIWRGIQRLTDIRNLCAHPGDREPTKEEVDELIRGVERITKTIF
jgi:hypothetical protein